MTVTRTSPETFQSSQQNSASSYKFQVNAVSLPLNEGEADISTNMSGFFTGILKICLLLSAPVAVSGQDINEERIDQSVPFNRSLLIYNEASQNLENVTRTIADLEEAIKETTKLKNEVRSCSSSKFFCSCT